MEEERKRCTYAITSLNPFITFFVSDTQRRKTRERDKEAIQHSIVLNHF